MKRLVIVGTILAILAMVPAAFGQVNYGWTVSGSSTNPDVNTGTATFGVANLYLWLQCSAGDGMAAAEFDLVPTGLTILATTTQNGYLNAGTVSALLLAVGGCPTGPVVAAQLLVLDLPGSICFAPSAVNGILGTVDCETPVPNLWPMEWRGYDNNGAAPCESTANPYLCEGNVSVEDASWGSIKGMYR